MDTLQQDLRYALRSLRRSRGFVTVAVLTLALGIGATSAVFTVLRSVVLRPLPFHEPDRIVTLWQQTEQDERMYLSAANFVDVSQRSRSFEALALHTIFGGPVPVLGGHEAVRAWVTGASSDFFRVMGTEPLLGRTFTAEELQPGGPGAAIVSQRFWQTRLGEPPQLAGTVIEVWGLPREVVGVMPPGFHYPGETDIWLPIAPDPGEGRRAHNYEAVGRLAGGVPPAAARAELQGIAAELKATHGADTDAVGFAVVELQEELVGHLRRPLWMLLGAAGLVLLIACTNLAGAMLARATAREAEFAVRSALGASRAVMARQLLVEALLLAVPGALAGLAAAYAIVRTVPSLAPGLPPAVELGLDLQVVGFAAALAVGTAVLFMLAPMLRANRATAAALIRSGGRTVPQRQRSWNLLVAGEVAMALLLLVGSGLLIRSLQELMRVDPGFRTEGVLTVDVALPTGRYADDEARAGYYDRALATLRELPGAERVGVVNHLPLSGFSWTGTFEVEGRGPDSGLADYRIASGEYFDAVGIPLLRGRFFDERDHGGASHAVIVSRSLAERYWPDGDAVGRRIGPLANDAWIFPDEWLTVVGVVGDVRHDGITAEPRPTAYVHYRQRPNRLFTATLVVLATGDPAALAGPARGRLNDVAADVPVEPATLAERTAETLGERRFALAVLGGFATLALLLAAIGIHGVVAYAMERRRREMGIRLALGAEPGRVRRYVIGRMMQPVAAGLVVGAVAALLASGLLRGLLYGIAPTYPVAYLAAVATLAFVALLASWLPARRTAAIDPVTVLKAE